MRKYELLFIVDPKLEQEELNTVNEKISGTISSGGGEVIEQNDWGTRRLAYQLGHLEEGHYILTEFRADPAQIKPLDRQLRLLQRVIRFIIVNQEE